MVVPSPFPPIPIHSPSPLPCPAPTSPSPSTSTLHAHVRLISSYLGPYPSDRSARHRVLSEVKSLIYSAYPHVEVHVIGSCATDLYLPDSDIDLVVRSSPSHPPLTLSDLHSLGSLLQPLASSLTVISTASVPLIKLVHAQSAFTVDLTLNVDTGIHSTALVLDYLDQFDVLRPLTIVVKQFLKARGLNDLYTGGLPSYTLILIIVSFLQLYRPLRQHAGEEDGGRKEREERKEEGEDGANAGDGASRPRRWMGRQTSSPSSSASLAAPRTATGSPTPVNSPSPPSPLTPSSTSSPSLVSPPPPPSDLGLYLLSFFHLYGVQFDYVSLGISTLLPGYFSKRERGFLHPHIPHLLCVENPLDRQTDLGFKVFRIREIVEAFAGAYVTLVDRMGVGPSAAQRRLSSDAAPPSDSAPIAPPSRAAAAAEEAREDSDRGKREGVREEAREELKRAETPVPAVAAEAPLRRGGRLVGSPAPLTTAPSGYGVHGVGEQGERPVAQSAQGSVGSGAAPERANGGSGGRGKKGNKKRLSRRTASNGHVPMGQQLQYHPL